MLFTDADCVPPRTWAKAMVSRFSKETGLVAGFSPQRAMGKKIWNGFLFLDSLAAAFVAAASIGRQSAGAIGRSNDGLGIVGIPGERRGEGTSQHFGPNWARRTGGRNHQTRTQKPDVSQC